MKTFIFIFILVVGFFFYLFSDSDGIPEKKLTEPIAYNLEDLEQNSSEPILEVKKEAVPFNEIPVAIPEDQTFDTIKNILKEASGREYAPDITLNTRINSYLYSVQAKEQFKQGISSSFNLSYDDVDKKFKEYKLVWDWVNQLKE